MVFFLYHSVLSGANPKRGLLTSQRLPAFVDKQDPGKNIGLTAPDVDATVPAGGWNDHEPLAAAFTFTMDPPNHNSGATTSKPLAVAGSTNQPTGLPTHLQGHDA